MGCVGIDKDYHVSIKEVIDITAETGALTAQNRIMELKPYDNENSLITDKEAHWAELLLHIIKNIETPMLMYQAEKDVVCKALKILLDKWNLQNK